MRRRRCWWWRRRRKKIIAQDRQRLCPGSQTHLLPPGTLLPPLTASNTRTGTGGLCFISRKEEEEEEERADQEHPTHPTAPQFAPPPALRRVCRWPPLPASLRAMSSRRRRQHLLQHLLQLKSHGRRLRRDWDLEGGGMCASGGIGVLGSRVWEDLLLDCSRR